MFQKQAIAKRSNVTVDDRRAVMAAVRGFKPTLRETQEQFIRNTLKDRLGWPRREPAPASIIQAAKDMSQKLIQQEREVRAFAAALKAKEAATKAVEKA